MSNLYAGLMSGTSLDGIDAILASFPQDARVKIHCSGFTPFPDQLRAQLMDLLNDPRRDRALARRIDIQLGKLYADAVSQVLQDHSASEVRAIGCHGQTILHEPSIESPFSWQAGDATTLANCTGIPVVDDFRTADMHQGGQGAPLAPAFHQFAFGAGNQAIVVVNIGGIANVTYLPANRNEPVIGFDTGPGNSLSDRWIRKSKGLPFDRGGQWAMTTQSNSDLLTAFMQDDYLREAPPKSLDTRYFSLEWLYQKLKSLDALLQEEVVQSTIAEFSAQSIWRAIEDWLPQVSQIVVCGGGAHNQAILNHLARLSGLEVVTSAAFGLSPDDVEACAFAWLAERRMSGIPANLPSVTGAQTRVLLGSITYPDYNV